MKHLVFILFIIIISNNVVFSQVSLNNTQDCIFDQTTQTDEFLKNIEELKDYVWFDDEKKAEIVLNDHWSLTIKRGGCDHFELSAEFFYERSLDFKTNKNLVFDNLIWIANLLDEFEGDIIRQCFENGKYSITEENENKFFINFLDVRIYESYLMTYNSDKTTTFILSYTIY
ncbi:hypothetical protein [Mesoflavibacter profundi]|uniref:hypothetical protein n=1 Tax=Mesoflavibacter profundi TaxID=2708110 RepID=UPI003513C694